MTGRRAGVRKAQYHPGAQSFQQVDEPANPRVGIFGGDGLQASMDLSMPIGTTFALRTASASAGVPFASSPVRCSGRGRSSSASSRWNHSPATLDRRAPRWSADDAGIGQVRSRRKALAPAWRSSRRPRNSSGMAAPGAAGGIYGLRVHAHASRATEHATPAHREKSPEKVPICLPTRTRQTSQGTALSRRSAAIARICACERQRAAGVDR